jgi:hypothetical protein
LILPGNPGRHHHILESAELGKKMVKLENKSDMGIPKQGELTVRCLVIGFSVIKNRAGLGFPEDAARLIYRPPKDR